MANEGVPFVGPSYELKRRKADTQRSINLMPTRVESGSGKSKQFLAPYPGLSAFSTGAELAEVHIFFTVTSRPYPVLVTDSIDAGAAPLRGRMYGINEELNASISVQGGSLRQILKTALTPIDPLDAGISLVSGELRQILKTALLPIDPLDASISVQSGSLRKVLITYDYWPVGPESIDASIQVISGSLI